MIKIHCHTNLILLNEFWPTELPEVPKVGDYIESGITHCAQPNANFILGLRVVEVRWRRGPALISTGYTPHIELGIPSRFESLREFYEWYAPAVGKRVSCFI